MKALFLVSSGVMSQHPRGQLRSPGNGSACVAYLADCKSVVRLNCNLHPRQLVLCAAAPACMMHLAICCSCLALTTCNFKSITHGSMTMLHG